MRDVLNQYDKNDPTSLHSSTRSTLLESSHRLDHKVLRIGVPREYNTLEIDRHVRQAWAASLLLLRERGHSLVPVSLPLTQSALSAYYVLAPSEASSNLAKYDGVRYGKSADTGDVAPRHVLYSRTRGSGFGTEVKRRILLGSYSLSAGAIDNYFIQAQSVRRLVQREFDRVFRRANPLLDARVGEYSDAEAPSVDVLITPTAPTLPPTIEALSKRRPTDNFGDDVMTVPASLAGLPAISVPVEVSKGEAGSENPSVPFAGIQIIGQYGDDELVLKVAGEL